MKRMIRVVTVISIVILLAAFTGCSKKAKYDVTGKWEASITYDTGETFTPEWVFKQDGTFHEFGGDVWGAYTMEGDKIKITKSDEKEYYSGTVGSKTHMSGNFFYVGFEDKKTITWEAVKVE